MSRPRLPRLPRPARRAVLVAHITVSVGWLGVSLCLLALAVAGARDPGRFGEAAYLAMKLFADWLLPPVALLSLTTGLVLSLGTAWGLAKYRWIQAKFWLTVTATALTVLSFGPAATRAAAMVTAGEAVPATDLLFPPAVSLCLYAFLTAVSVLKPWGMTRRGRRLHAARGDGGARTGSGARAGGGAGTRTGARTGKSAVAARTPRKPVEDNPPRRPA